MEERNLNGTNVESDWFDQLQVELRGHYPPYTWKKVWYCHLTHGVPIKKIEAIARMRIINYFPDPTDVKKFHLIVKLDMDSCFLSQNYNNAIHKTNHT